MQSLTSQNRSEEVFTLNVFAAFSVSSSSKFRYALFTIRYKYKFITIINLVSSVQKLFICTEILI